MPKCESIKSWGIREIFDCLKGNRSETPEFNQPLDGSVIRDVAVEDDEGSVDSDNMDRRWRIRRQLANERREYEEKYKKDLLDDSQSLRSNSSRSYHREKPDRTEPVAAPTSKYYNSNVAAPRSYYARKYSEKVLPDEDEIGRYSRQSAGSNKSDLFIAKNVSRKSYRDIGGLELGEVSAPRIQRRYGGANKTRNKTDFDLSRLDDEPVKKEPVPPVASRRMFDVFSRRSIVSKGDETSENDSETAKLHRTQTESDIPQNNYSVTRLLSKYSYLPSSLFPSTSSSFIGKHRKYGDNSEKRAATSYLFKDRQLPETKPPVSSDDSPPLCIKTLHKSSIKSSNDIPAAVSEVLSLKPEGEIKDSSNKPVQETTLAKSSTTGDDDGWNGVNLSRVDSYYRNRDIYTKSIVGDDVKPVVDSIDNVDDSRSLIKTDSFRSVKDIKLDLQRNDSKISLSNYPLIRRDSKLSQSSTMNELHRTESNRSIKKYPIREPEVAPSSEFGLNDRRKDSYHSNKAYPPTRTDSKNSLYNNNNITKTDIHRTDSLKSNDYPLIRTTSKHSVSNVSGSHLGRTDSNRSKNLKATLPSPGDYKGTDLKSLEYPYVHGFSDLPPMSPKHTEALTGIQPSTSAELKHSKSMNIHNTEPLKTQTSLKLKQSQSFSRRKQCSNETDQAKSKEKSAKTSAIDYLMDMKNFLTRDFKSKTARDLVAAKNAENEAKDRCPSCGSMKIVKSSSSSESSEETTSSPPSVALRPVRKRPEPAVEYVPINRPLRRRERRPEVRQTKEQIGPVHRRYVSKLCGALLRINATLV